MKVLITGGSGYLGQATIRALQAHGHQAVALARSDDADRRIADLGATVVRGGLTDLDVLHKTAMDVDAAIHLAQDYGPDTAGVDLRAATAMRCAVRAPVPSTAPPTGGVSGSGTGAGRRSNDVVSGSYSLPDIVVDPRSMTFRLSGTRTVSGRPWRWRYVASLTAFPLKI